MVRKEEMDEMRGMVKTICDKVNGIEHSLSDMKGQVTSILSQMQELIKVKKDLVEFKNIVLEDAREREIKSKQLVFFNVKEVDRDDNKAAVEKVLGALELPKEFKFVKRIGKPREDGKPRPLTVGFHRSTECEDVLSKSNQLRHNKGLQDIRISKDLTKLQQLAERDLHREMEERNSSSKKEEGFVWRVVGRRGEGRLIRVREFQDQRC